MNCLFCHHWAVSTPASVRLDLQIFLPSLSFSRSSPSALRYHLQWFSPCYRPSLLELITLIIRRSLFTSQILIPIVPCAFSPLTQSLSLLSSCLNLSTPAPEGCFPWIINTVLPFFKRQSKGYSFESHAIWKYCLSLLPTIYLLVITPFLFKKLASTL